MTSGFGMRTEKFYYVDKTKLIKELLNNWAKVNLFTRPRRFGKSLNMSMLKIFFEIGTEKNFFLGASDYKRTYSLRRIYGEIPGHICFSERNKCREL